MANNVTLRTPSTTGYGCCVWDSDPRWTMLKSQDILESTRMSELSQIQAQDTSFDSVTESFPMAAILEIGERGNQNTSSGQSETKKMYQAYKGQLKLSISVIDGFLSIHVLDACHLTTKCGSCCSSHVEVDMIPKISRRTQCRTATVTRSSHPVYNEKFSYELLGRDYQRRILISVYQSADGSDKELIGSMSFGIKNLAEKHTKVEGYYFLLADKIGQQKHMKVHTDEKKATPMTSNKTPAAKSSSQFRATVPTPGRMNATGQKPSIKNTPVAKIPTTTCQNQKRALNATPRSNLCRSQLRSNQGQVKRSRKCSQGSSSNSSGSDADSIASDDRMMEASQIHLSLPMYTSPSDQNFGLHLSHGCPTVVSRIEQSSPAHRAGLMTGDVVVAINGKDVSEMYPDSVAGVIRYYSRCSLIEVIRDVRNNPSSTSSGSRRVIGLDTVVPVCEDCAEDDFFEVTETYKQVRPAVTREHSVIGRREQSLSQFNTPAAKRDVVPLVKMSSKKKFFKLF